MRIAKRGPYLVPVVSQRDSSITGASVASADVAERIIAIAVFGIGMWIAPAIYLLTTTRSMTPAEWQPVLETFGFSALAATVGFAVTGVRDVRGALFAVPVAMLLTLLLLPPGLGIWLSDSVSLNLAVVGLILAIAGAAGGWLVGQLARVLGSLRSA